MMNEDISFYISTFHHNRLTCILVILRNPVNRIFNFKIDFLKSIACSVRMSHLMIMNKMIKTQEEVEIESLIMAVRGKKVILDSDLAKLYGVSTKRLNEQVKRNADRFPADFVFQLTSFEYNALRSQIATSNGSDQGKYPVKNARGGRRYPPFAFTEHGAIMAANVLNSPRAVQISIFVVRAFIRIRSLMNDTRKLAAQLSMLEKELKERLDMHESAIVSILQRIMDLIDPPELSVPPHKPIGFSIKESPVRYGNQKRTHVDLRS
jgi:phage regulator Rha-like protein